MTSQHFSADEVLDYWFGHETDEANIAKEKQALWWGGSAELDEEISRRFAQARAAAIAGQLAEWECSPRGRLALIILVDQFSRNIFRGSTGAFEHDAMARRWCDEGIALGQDRALRGIERVFFYLPLEHSESREIQQRSIEQFEGLAATAPDTQRELFAGYVDFARRHQKIIDRFGRFPHRNAILGRTSTDEELAFLKEPGSSF